MQASLQEIDMLKAQIYEDFLNSIASVRAGQNSEIAFREHENRVRALRQRVAVAEGHPEVRPQARSETRRVPYLRVVN